MSSLGAEGCDSEAPGVGFAVEECDGTKVEGWVTPEIVWDATCLKFCIVRLSVRNTDVRSNKGPLASEGPATF